MHANSMSLCITLGRIDSRSPWTGKTLLYRLPSYSRPTIFLKHLHTVSIRYFCIHLISYLLFCRKINDDDIMCLAGVRNVAYLIRENSKFGLLSLISKIYVCVQKKYFSLSVSSIIKSGVLHHDICAKVPRPNLSCPFFSLVEFSTSPNGMASAYLITEVFHFHTHRILDCSFAFRSPRLISNIRLHIHSRLSAARPPPI